MAWWQTPGINPNAGSGFDPFSMLKPMGGLFSGPQIPQGGVLGEPQINPQQDARMAMAAQLLAGSGWSPQRQSFGQVLGQALMAGQQARQASQQQLDQRRQAQSMEELRQAQIDQMQRPEAEPVVAIMDPATGKPKYVPRSQAAGMAPATNDPAAGVPANVAETQWYLKASPEERAAYDKLNGREQAPYYQWVQRVLPDGSTQQGVFNARSGATQWSEQAVAPGTKPRVDAEGKAIGEAEGGQKAKLPAEASMDYVLGKMEEQLPKTTQGGVGGIAGKAGAVFDYKDASRFDNLREQLSTELRTVYRIPGEGTLSDREQAQYGLQLPSRNNAPEVNKAIIEDLRQRTRLRMTTTIGSQWSGGVPQGGAPSVRHYNPSTGKLE